ncbi:DNA recombination protein RmuC [bacterium]|nr:DNA recombination protein RmuC [bacterium]MBU1983497.1 DNA recombination protein RmuC [bacterium]
MSLTIILSLASAALVALIAYFALHRAIRKGGEASELETRLMARLDSVLEAMGRWRDESRSTVQEKMTELYGKIEEHSRAARAETHSTLDQFRTTLEGNRQAVAGELARNRDESRQSLESVTRSLTERFEKLQASNEQKLSEIRGEVERKLSETLERSGQAFKDVTDRLSQLHETNQRIMQFSQDLHELQNILKAPRLRGEMGEVEMERMLRDCLAPDQFEIQFDIEGSRVDAIIRNPQGLLPIDSKFPLEAWRRVHDPETPEAERNAARKDFMKAAKGHMDTIAAKYIRPPATLDFAVMYVPAEGVYYEIIETPDLAEYARQRRIFPASPITFWALLQVTVIGFRGLRISENARRIAGLLSALHDDFEKVRDAFTKAGKQLGYAKTNMDEAAGHLDRFEVKLGNVQSSPLGEGERREIEPPEGEDA